MYDRYPTVVRNSESNYENISVSAKFLPVQENGCDYDISDKARVKYLNQAKDFLRNGEVKILKSMDGRVWLVDIDMNSITDSANNYYANRQLTFSCIEIGDVEDEEQLWEYGFISESVTGDYWAK